MVSLKNFVHRMLQYFKRRTEPFKILLKFTSLIFGAILTWRFLLLLGYVLLFLNSLLLFILLLDLDLSKSLTGENIKPLRFFSPLLGSLVPVTVRFSLEILGIAIFMGFLVAVILFRKRILTRINWSNDKRLQRSYNRLLQEELAKDPELLDKEIVIWRRRQLSASEFLKTLALLKVTLEVIIYVIILAFFITSIGHNYSLELSLFILFILLALSSSRNLVTKSGLTVKEKLGMIFERRGSLKKGTWLSFIKSFSNLRGFYYSTFFIPSIMSAVGILSISFEFYASLIKGLTSNEQLLSPMLLILASFFAFALLPLLVIIFIYPFYITIKLIRVNHLRCAHMLDRANKETRILPSPYLCLSTSVLFAFLFFMHQFIPDVFLFDEITLYQMLAYVIIASVFMIWIRMLWLKHQGQREELDVKMERNLAIIMGIWATPFYCMAFSLEMIFMLGFLIIWALFFTILKVLSTSEYRKREVVAPLFLFGVLYLYVVLLAPEYLFTVPLIILELSLLVLLLFPTRYLDKLAKLVFRVRVAKTNHNN